LLYHNLNKSDILIEKSLFISKLVFCSAILAVVCHQDLTDLDYPEIQHNAGFFVIMESRRDAHVEERISGYNTLEIISEAEKINRI